MTKEHKAYEEAYSEGIKDGYQKFKELKKELITKLQKRANKLYCTEEGLGYHDKNCEGTCEKATLKRIIKSLK